MPLQVHGRLCLQPVFVVSNLATPAILALTSSMLTAYYMTVSHAPSNFLSNSRPPTPPPGTPARRVASWPYQRLPRSLHYQQRWSLPGDSRLKEPLSGTAHWPWPPLIVRIHPLITGGPALVQLNHQRQTYMRLFNTHTHYVS